MCVNQLGNSAKALAIGAGILIGTTALTLPAMAHFQELIPSADYVAEDQKAEITLNLLFTHPMEGRPAMEMQTPVKFGVTMGGKTVDLRDQLRSIKTQGVQSFTANYTLPEPNDYIFHVEPAPYWEPAEGKSIIHYTKVIVDYGMADGWDELVGLPVEIEPLVQPYGLFTGNVFRGIVRANGKPVPNAEIEVEWKNDGSLAPQDPFVTQVIKANEMGEFSYAMPRAGWWGFAALIDAPYTLKDPKGQDKPVELGGLIWVKATDMNSLKAAGK